MRTLTTICLSLITLAPLAVGQEAEPAEASTVKAAAAELSSLTRELDAVEKEFSRESLEGALVRITRVGSRLDAFELRFGLKPKTVEGWQALATAAKSLLTEAKQRSEQGVYFNQNSARVAYATLVAIEGHEGLALDVLRAVKPGGGCGNWHATVLLSVRRRISGILQRRGDYAAALEAHRSAIEELGATLYFPEADLFFARYADLLLRTGAREPGLAQFQRVVDLFPKTPGAALAERRLKALKHYVAPSAARILKAYAKGGERERVIFALAEHAFPESLELLTRDLATAKGWERNRIIPALAMLGDKRAIPALREVFDAGSFANCTHAVASLHELGDKSAIDLYLDQLPQLGDDVDLDWAHQQLVELCGGGPDRESLEDEDADLTDPGTIKFVTGWRAWIAAQRK